MEYAGYSKPECRSKSAAYAKVSRWYTKLQIAEAEDLARNAASLPAVNTNLPAVDDDNTGNTITPESETQDGRFTFLGSGDSDDDTHAHNETYNCGKSHTFHESKLLTSMRRVGPTCLDLSMTPLV